MMHLVSAKLTIAHSIYKIERAFKKTRLQAIKSVVQVFLPI